MSGRSFRQCSCLVALLFSLAGTAQHHHDNIWIFSAINGAAKADFSSGFPVVDTIGVNIYFEGGSATICNAEGKLQFYTNGCALYNYRHEKMVNGDSINPGYYYNEFCNIRGRYQRGYPVGPGTTMIVPWPRRPDEYLVLHKALDPLPEPINGQPLTVRRFLATHVDMRANGGRGRVPSKAVLIDDRRAEGAHFLNRHANGEDWWVISPLRDTNAYAIYLLDSTGIELYHVQQIGNADTRFTRFADQSVFSPQGEIFYRYSSLQGIQIFDFDRETGLLSNFRFVEMPYIDRTPMSGGFGGIGISPSGRFAYVSTILTIYQYDLWAEDIAGSRLTVGNLMNPNNNHPIFHPVAFNFQLGPDCKLYAYADNTNAHHVIHYPDELGLACQWEQDAMQLPFPIFRDQPAFPNFRLGPLGKESSPCAAPIVSQREVVRQSRQAVVDIYPNPARDYLRLSLRFSSQYPAGTWRLFDALGRPVKTAQLSNGQLQELALGDLPAGLYFWHFSSGAELVDQGKLVVE